MSCVIQAALFSKTKKDTLSQQFVTHVAPPLDRATSLPYTMVRIFPANQLALPVNWLLLGIG